jgi:hypothetical protein
MANANKASTAKLRTITAIAATSMMESRFAMRQFFRQSSGGVDLDHVRRPVASCDRPAVNVPARSVSAVDTVSQLASEHCPAKTRA